MEKIEIETDAALFTAGRRMNRQRRQLCTSLIVATDAQGIRNYHQCNGEKDHTLADNAYVCTCGCGQTWTETKRTTQGPLTEVVFQ